MEEEFAVSAGVGLFLWECAVEGEKDYKGDANREHALR